MSTGNALTINTHAQILQHSSVGVGEPPSCAVRPVLFALATKERQRLPLGEGGFPSVEPGGVPRVERSGETALFAQRLPLGEGGFPSCRICFPVGRWALPTNAKIGPLGQWWAMPTLQK